MSLTAAPCALPCPGAALTFPQHHRRPPGSDGAPHGDGAPMGPLWHSPAPHEEAGTAGTCAGTRWAPCGGDAGALAALKCLCQRARI